MLRPGLPMVARPAATKSTAVPQGGLDGKIWPAGVSTLAGFVFQVRLFCTDLS
jgi:hypothetical protein